MGQTIVAYTKFLTEYLQMLSLNWWQSTRRPGNITNFKRDFGPEHWWLFFSDVLFGNLVEKMRVFFLLNLVNYIIKMASSFFSSGKQRLYVRRIFWENLMKIRAANSALFACMRLFIILFFPGRQTWQEINRIKWGFMIPNLSLELIFCYDHYVFVQYIKESKLGHVFLFLSFLLWSLNLCPCIVYFFIYWRQEFAFNWILCNVVSSFLL